MNKLIWSKDIGKKISNVDFGDEFLTVFFEDNSSIKFSTHHDQDCCESVYGDFSIFKYHREQLINKPIVSIKVKGVFNMGFLISFKTEYENYVKVFVACYNYQNGYYSSNLDLAIEHGNTREEIGISDCVEDHIN